MKSRYVVLTSPLGRVPVRPFSFKRGTSRRRCNYFRPVPSSPSTFSSFRRLGTGDSRAPPTDSRFSRTRFTAVRGLWIFMQFVGSVALRDRQLTNTLLRDDPQSIAAGVSRFYEIPFKTSSTAFRRVIAPPNADGSPVYTPSTRQSFNLLFTSAQKYDD